MGDKVCTGVLAIGIPASLGSLLMSVSQIILNSQMAHYGNMAVAGIGVAAKVTMITGMICVGVGQGVQPLIGFCVGARKWERFKKIMNFSVVFALLLSVVMTGICYLFTEQIVHAFLTDQTAFEYGMQFSRILLSTSFLFGLFMCFATRFRSWRCHGGTGCEPEPTGNHIHSRSVYHADSAGYYGACLGTARGGCAFPGAGCSTVYLHNAENESQNESGNILILTI